MGLAAARRNLAPLVLTLLTLFVFAPAGRQARAQTAATDEGHLLEITLRPDKETILLGEPTYLTLEIKNHSSQELCVVEGGDYRNEIGRPNSFTVTVVGDDGKPVPQPEVKLDLGGFAGCHKMPPGGSHVVRLLLPHWATFEAAGAYTVNVRKPLTIQNHATDSTSSVAADARARINVAPADEKKLGDVIDSFGAAMLDKDNPEATRSAKALAYVDDKRAIKYFAQALAKFGAGQAWMDEYFISSQAAAALALFNDDSALAALEAAMTSPAEDTRLDVATAFGRSEHPEALGLLLKMRGDDYWFVRLRVAQGLRKAKSDEARAALRKLLKDVNEDVREAARESLSARARK